MNDEFSPYMKKVISSYLNTKISDVAGAGGNISLVAKLVENKNEIKAEVLLYLESDEAQELLENAPPGALAGLLRGITNILFEQSLESMIPTRNTSSPVADLLDSLTNTKTTTKKTKFKAATIKSKEKAKSIIEGKQGSLLNSNSRWQSIFNLRALIENRAKQGIKQDMHSPALNFRSGRFWNSVQLNRLVPSKTGDVVSLYFSYMVYPYQVFEPGVPSKHPAKAKLATKERNPRKLLTYNFQKAAYDILHKKYRIKVIQEGGYPGPAV